MITKDNLVFDYYNEILNGEVCSISKNLLEDNMFIIEALKINKKFLNYLSEKRQKDPVLFKLIKKFFSLDEFELTNSMKNNVKIMMEIVKKNPYNITLADKTLLSNKKFALSAMKYTSNIITYFSEEIKSDKEVILKGLRTDSFVLGHINYEMLLDEDIYIKAMKKYPGVLSSCIYQKILTNKTISTEKIFELMVYETNFLTLLSEKEINKNKERIFKIFKKNVTLFNHMNPKWKKEIYLLADQLNVENDYLEESGLIIDDNDVKNIIEKNNVSLFLFKCLILNEKFKDKSKFDMSNHEIYVFLDDKKRQQFIRNYKLNTVIYSDEGNNKYIKIEGKKKNKI